MNFQSVSLSLKTFDNINLHYIKNLVDNPKAIILISHGLAEHCQRYDYITNKLNTLEYSVYRYDYRGHGLSDGKRGFFNDINDLVNDVSIFINLIKQENPNSPIFLLGYDIGGHILLEYGHQFKKQVNGIILCSPLVCDTLGLTKTKYTNVNDFTLIPINKSQDYTHNPTIQNKYENDPMVLKKIPLGTYKSLRKSCFGIIDNLYKFKYPTLILHSSSDNIISHEDSKFLFENILSLDKDIRILNGLYHNLLDEIVRDNIIEEICKWIEKRLS